MHNHDLYTIDGKTMKKRLEIYRERFEELKRQRFPESDEQFIADYKSIPSMMNACAFFGKYGVGNTLFDVNRPLERMEAYESLLDILIQIDEDQFNKIHKGTPYYFFAWTSLQLRDYSKALFYMDAAVSEDINVLSPKSVRPSTPALAFFLLCTTTEEVKKPNGYKMIHQPLLNSLNETLKEYNKRSGCELDIEDIKNKFVLELLNPGSKQRTLLTALYTFLLEYPEKLKQIKLRGETGGSIQPFINHLFDGARLLESLLKVTDGELDTLGERIDSLAPDLKLNIKVVFNGGKKKLSNAIEKYTELKDRSFQDRNFACAFIIRNTTGHSLLWDDCINVMTYNLLYNSLVNSIFWTIDKLWLNKTEREKMKQR